MKVLLLNGGPHKEGCVYTALREIAGELDKAEVESEIFHAGTKPIRSCMGCGACKRNGNGRCIYDEDVVNPFLEKAEKADGFFFGSPVHYSGASGMITALLGRCFYANEKAFSFKPASAIVTLRRGGATTAIDQINRFIAYADMPVVSSQYWPMVHGNTPDEIRQDLEGLQIMRGLGQNMAWLLKCIQAGRDAGVPHPEKEPLIRTNFIR